jgi:hypothetical protein
VSADWTLCQPSVSDALRRPSASASRRASLRTQPSPSSSSKLVARILAMPTSVRVRRATVPRCPNAHPRASASRIVRHTLREPDIRLAVRDGASRRWTACARGADAVPRRPRSAVMGRRTRVRGGRCCCALYAALLTALVQRQRLGRFERDQLPSLVQAPCGGHRR